jgi:hypothetical protein
MTFGRLELRRCGCRGIPGIPQNHKIKSEKKIPKIKDGLPSGYLFNIAMENGPFVDGSPIKNVDFPWLC